MEIPTLKIVLLGDNFLGKTTLVNRYLTKVFDEDMKMTIGVDVYSKDLEINRKKVKLQIWDLGAEQRFRFLLHQYCKGANAAFFLYDIINRLSLYHLPDWTQIIREHAGDIPIILVGAKAHFEELRSVSKEEGILAAEKYNLSGFIEVSSKTGQNVKEAFELIIAKSLEKYSTEIPKISRKLSRKERKKYLKRCPVCGSSKIKKELSRIVFFHHPCKWTDRGSHSWDPPFPDTMEEAYEYILRCRHCGYVWDKSPFPLLARDLLEGSDENIGENKRFVLKRKDTIKPKDFHYDILLVNDDLATIRLLTGYFESKDITCKGVVSGTKALEELKYNTPKLILTDIIHPAPSGYDLCKKIKSNQKLKNIPVFFLTAISGSEVEKHLAETKADGYINKPFNYSDFDIILDLVNPPKDKKTKM